MKKLLLSLLLASPAFAQVPLSFNEALTRITSESTTVKQARVTEGAAKYQKDHASYVYAPELNAFGTVKRLGNDSDGLTTVESRSVGVGAEMNVYRFGGDKARVNQAEATYQASTFSAQAAAKGAEVEAAGALFDLIEAEETRRVTEGILAIQKDNLNVIRKLYERGARPAQDTEKVEIDTANAAVRLTDAELNVEAARSAITALSGQAITIKSEWPWRDRLINDGGTLADNLQGIDLSKRPERQALAERVKALDASLTAARSKYMPSLDLSADYDFVKPTQPVDRDLSKQWTGALTLSVPIFDGFVSRGLYEDQAKLKQIAELDLAATDRQLKSELDQVRAGFSAALKSAKAREVALKSARTLYDHSLKGFRSGVLSANDLILDQGRVFDTELNTVKGWSAVHRYLARLCKIAGRALTECVTP